MQKINTKKIPFLEQCKNGLLDSDCFCEFCGSIKKEFISPLTGQIVLLDCACEQEYKMLRNFLELNAEWIMTPNKRPKTIPDYTSATNSLERSDQQQKFINKVREVFERFQAKRAEMQNLMSKTKK